MHPHALAMVALGGGLGVTSLLVYLMAACVIPLSIIWRPIVGLYMLIPLMPLQTMRYHLQALPFGDKLVDALLLSVLLGLFLHRNGAAVLPTTPLNRYLLWFCIFLYVMLWVGSFMRQLPLPILPSNDRFAVWKNTVEMPLFFIVVTAAVKDKKQMMTLLALMMITVLRANLGFYHTVSSRDFTHFSNNLRYSGVFGYAGQNGLAAFMAELLIFLLALASGVRNFWYKALVYASILLAAYCVLLSFSRGAYVGTVAGLIFLGVMKERKYLIVVAVLLATWQTVVPNAVRERILMTYDGNGVESSANERLQLWEDAFTIIPEHPILGTGFDTYRYLGRSADYLDTHNYYVKVTVETGFVGLGLFLYLLWIMTREGIRLFHSSNDPFFGGIGLAFAALMVCSAFVNVFGDRWMYQQVTAYMWTFLGLVCRARIIEQNHRITAVEPGAHKRAGRRREMAGTRITAIKEEVPT
jgi:putative inorganic carbon (HCO3(-)) transporter